MSLPCGVVVSARGSPKDLKLAPLSLIVASVFSRSLVLLAIRVLSRLIDKHTGAIDVSNTAQHVPS